MEEERVVAVSPKHSVRLAREYADLIERPQRSDYLLRTIQRREANGLFLMSADIVIAGYETRALHELAVKYPLHFRKTYSHARLGADPAKEFENHTLASQMLGIPPPIGHAPYVFRSCLIPGRPYVRLSPFGADPEDSNIRLAQKLPLESAAGLWGFLENAMGQIAMLHRGGLAHGDAELHNIVVSPTPLDAVVVDFEAAVKRDELTEAAWQARCHADLVPLLRESTFVQCALGRQRGPLADATEQAMATLFRAPDRFRQAIDLQRELGE